MNAFKTPLSGEFHIFRILKEGNKSILSSFEKERYDGFGSPSAARAYLLGHSGAREIASYYTGKSPAQFEWQTNKNGKPFFQCTPGLHFNLSHSGEDIFIVFSCEEVGFDIENKNRHADFPRLAKRFFHPSEIGFLQSAQQTESVAFLELWTAKEAMVKLMGTGLSEGLEKAIVLNCTEGSYEDKKIHLHRYEYGDLTGSLASFTKPQVVREFTF